MEYKVSVFTLQFQFKKQKQINKQRKQFNVRRKKYKNKGIKKLIKKIMETTTVMIIIRTMEIGNNCKSTQYRKKHNKQ